MERENLIQRIRNYVEDHDVDLTQLAIQAGIPQNLVRHVTKPYWKPDDHTLQALEIIIDKSGTSGSAPAAFKKPPPPKIFCAIDTGDLKWAKKLIEMLMEQDCGFKIGMEFFHTQGPKGMYELLQVCPDSSIFLDLKLHDIPKTVANTIQLLMPLHPTFINVHATGGYDMMRTTKDLVDEYAALHRVEAPKLLAVTVLTSMNEADMHATGQTGSIPDQVRRLAKLTHDAGLDGVVCSGDEIGIVREACGPDFTLMVPGIRLENAIVNSDDQKRVMTPKTALAAGANHLVIGRPITQASDPQQALADIIKSLR